MEFIINYWYIIVAGVAVVTAAVLYAVGFFRMPSDAQLTKIREWLLYAVVEAEKAFGSQTGKLKLRYVYDLFLGKFSWVARLISFEMFSRLVDEALDEMHKLLDTNEAIAGYVNTDKECL